VFIYDVLLTIVFIYFKNIVYLFLLLNQGIGIGYVEFEDPSYVSEAIALSGSQLGKRPIRVERCHKSGKTVKNRNSIIGRSAKRQKVGSDRSTRGKGKITKKGNSSNFRGAEASINDDVKKYKPKKKSKGHGKKKKRN
jgi:hypothetical protein